MTWGAVNEWTTQAGYARLAARRRHPVLTELLRRIMRQEGRHIDFYATQAHRRLRGRPPGPAADPAWRCAGSGGRSGSGVMPEAEVRFMVGHLFGGPRARAVDRIDRRIDRLPGLEGSGCCAAPRSAMPPDGAASRAP